MTKIPVPCHGCIERHENCHGTCTKYLEFQWLHEQQKEQIRKAKAPEQEQDQITRTRIARVAGGKIRRKHGNQ